MSLSSRNPAERSISDLPTDLRFKLTQCNQHIQINKNEVSSLQARRLDSLKQLEASRRAFRETQSTEAGQLLQQHTAGFQQIEIRLKRLTAELTKATRQRDLLLKQHQLIPTMKDSFFQELNDVPLTS